MDLIIAAVVIGVVGTAVMDLGNLLFARLGLISRVDLRVLGRMATGWARGRFRYADPSEMAETEHEAVYGFFTHYCIGVGLALPYLLGWELLVGGPAPPALAVLYGTATTIASWFFVYPSMGLGALGLQSSEGWKPARSSLLNHLFYGLGLAGGLGLITLVGLPAQRLTAASLEQWIRSGYEFSWTSGRPMRDEVRQVWSQLGSGGVGYGFRTFQARGGAPDSIPSMEYWRVTLDELHTSVVGDIGLAWGVHTEEFKLKGQPPETIRVRFTNTLSWNGRRWENLLYHRDTQVFGENGTYVKARE